jgi:1-deoxyxylulose-5-phosphate synthase
LEYTSGVLRLKVSRIAMGTMSFGDGSGGREGWPIPYDDAAPFFRQALDLGITFWDTANCYNGDTWEQAVGRALKEFTAATTSS